MSDVCIHCAAMADEIAELRRSLGLSGRLTERRALERTLGLNPQQARLVQTLYDAGGKVVPRATLDAIVLTAQAYEDGSDALKVIVCRARSVLGKDAIDTAEGGYAMTQAGRALVCSALAVGVAA